MDKTRLSSKGQIVIPKSVREAHGWEEGTELTVENTSEGVLLKSNSRSPFPKTTIDEVLGCANYKGPRRSLKDMKRGIYEAMRERWERKSK